MKKIIFIIMLLVTYQHTIAKPTEHQSKNSISCNTNVGEIVKITKSQMLDYGKACTSDTNSGVSNFVWGTDAGATKGTPEGSCKSAKDEAYNKPKSACYCYQAENVSNTSAVSNGNWMCWVGK